MNNYSLAWEFILGNAGALALLAAGALQLYFLYGLEVWRWWVLFQKGIWRCPTSTCHVLAQPCFSLKNRSLPYRQFFFIVLAVALVKVCFDSISLIPPLFDLLLKVTVDAHILSWKQIVRDNRILCNKCWNAGMWWRHDLSAWAISVWSYPACFWGKVDSHLSSRFIIT